MRGMRRSGLAALALAPMFSALVACGGARQGGSDLARPPGSGGGEKGRGRLAIVGMAGAAWRGFEPLVAQGRLPPFARLIRGGPPGALRRRAPSAPPPLGPPLA